MTYNKHIFDVQNKKVIRDFESAYKNFDNVYPGQFQIDSPKFRLVIDRINLMGKKVKILDIGAGYGAFINHLHQDGIDAIGIDISPTAVEQGKNLYGPDIKLQTGDFLKGLDFADNTFDIIVCYGVFQYVLDFINPCLIEMKRLLKPDGLAALSMGFKNTNVFFREIISDEKDFLEIISKELIIEDFLVYYHEIGTQQNQSQDIDLSSQSRDFLVFARNNKGI